MNSGLANNLIIVMMGVIATAVMTGFTDGIARAFRKPFHVVVILSVMLRFKYVTDVESINPYRYSFAIIVHYGIGVIFAAVYVFSKNIYLRI